MIMYAYVFIQVLPGPSSSFIRVPMVSRGVTGLNIICPYSPWHCGVICSLGGTEPARHNGEKMNEHSVSRMQHTYKYS